MQFGDRRAFAEAEFDAAVGDEVERRDFFGDARGVIRRQLDDAVAEPNVLRALARGGEEDLRGRRVRILLEEVVFDLPRVVEAQFVGEFDLIERVA